MTTLGQPWQIRLRLDGSRSRISLVEALKQALLAADPRIIIRDSVRVRNNLLQVSEFSIKLDECERILVIGGGKASAGMALELARILGNRITGGSVNIPIYTKPWPTSPRIVFNPATHPIPSQRGVQGVENMLHLIGKPSRKDLVICLISGGGSALMPLPAPGITLSNKRKTTELLLKSGANIHDTNTVRKHLSGFKGGRFAEKLQPATVLSLIISDVVGDELESIASGPTVPDNTTYQNAFEVLENRGLLSRVPTSVRDHISNGMTGEVPETPKPGSSVFNHVHNFLVGSNKQACGAAARELRKRGYRTLVYSTTIEGESRDVGKTLSRMASDIEESQIPIAPPAAIVAGGETTVTVRGEGRGGRNQEFALSSALSIHGSKGVLVASIGTDGVDGPTDAAGAVADGTTVERGLQKDMDGKSYLENNGSYPFFEKLNDLIITGPTGTNVNDIMIAIVERSKEKHDTVTRSGGR